MGVPCVTMAGHVHAHNVGVTLLHQVGMYPNSGQIFCFIRFHEASSSPEFF